MRQGTCIWESQVRLGRDPDIRDFREHLFSCAECQDSLAIRAWFQKFAALPLEGPPPNPGHLWFKGQVLRRLEQQRRSTVSMQRMQVGLGVAGVIALFAWLWRQLQRSAAFDSSLPFGSEADFSRALPAILVLSLTVLIVAVSLTVRDIVASPVSSPTVN
jgi:hypothetical protein